MRHAVILAHPDRHSFNAAVAQAYVEAVEGLSHEATLRDLYALGFDPRLQVRELPWRADYEPGHDVVAERAALSEANVLVFVYPLWFNAPPAMLKGYVERVLGMGFGYAPSAPGTRPLLEDKLLVSISTSGAPEAWVDQTGALLRLRSGFDDYLGAVCGLRVLEHLNLGGVTPGIRPDAAEEMLNQVRALARRLFGAVVS
jgi:NAD(P)H dehydrogenase (quinone)